MGDSSSFSSLFALVDSHLSKSNLQQDERQSKPSDLSSRLSLLSTQRKLSENRLSSPLKLPVSSLSLNKPSLDISKHLRPEVDHDESVEPAMCVTDRPIHDVLSIQLSNMFKARQAKEEEERKKQEELIEAEKALQQLKLEESSRLIDLLPAVQYGQVQQHKEVLSSGSSMESLNIPNAFDEVDNEPQLTTVTLDLSRPVSPKPITRDMSYILNHKIGKCSQFGKVLCARYRPVAAPYFRTPIPPNNIKVFDFSTPSPDDLILERLKKPSCYGNSNTYMVYDTIS